jgi:predicted transcriptional regulator
LKEESQSAYILSGEEEKQRKSYKNGIFLIDKTVSTIHIAQSLGRQKVYIIIIKGFLMNNKSSNTLNSRVQILAENTSYVIQEILKMDRFLYLDIIRKKAPLTSLQVTHEILALKENCEPDQIDSDQIHKQNPNINRRLTILKELGALNSEEGKYSLSSIGIAILEELEKLDSSIKILRKYKDFFDAHDYIVIPPQIFSNVHNLRFAQQCKDVIEYNEQIESNTAQTEDKIYVITEHLHDIPGWIVEELKLGNLKLKLVYQFEKPFELNSNDETEQDLWKQFTQEMEIAVEIRFIKLKDRNPIGIRIVDDKWAILNFFEISEEKLNRPRSFYGSDERFVAWTKEIFFTIWDNATTLPRNR